MIRQIVTMTLLVALAATADAMETKTPTRKSTSEAAAYSVGATLFPVGIGFLALSHEDPGDGAVVIGVGLLALGSIAGPSMGHIYAENWNHALKGAAIRTVSWGLMDLMLVSAAQKGPEGGRAALKAVRAGVAVISVSILVDWATLGRSAAAYNRKHGFTNVSVAPTYGLADNTAGLRFALKF